jgi:hypothetical protein
MGKPTAAGPGLGQTQQASKPRADLDQGLLGPQGFLAASARRKAFLAQLARMSTEERLRAARHEFDRRQRSIWAGRYPEEVPTVNGEVEWIALGLADLD